MSIKYAILGMLSYKPLTGYDLKKIMQDSSFMPWSGNNNQIYKALLELDDNDFVTSEVRHQENSPSKKIYTITEAGLAELKKWLQSVPETFEIKKPFLIQLAWIAILSDEELEKLLNQYEQEIRGQIFIEQTKSANSFFKQGRTPRETAIWNLIKENTLLSFQSELEWIRKVKTVLLTHSDIDQRHISAVSTSIKENEEMTFRIIEKSNQRYILLGPAGKPIQTEQEAIQLFTVCLENNTNLLLIHGERLSDDFLRLRTGIAGIALQKFATYGIKAAAIIDEKRTKGKFREFLNESNRGHVFRSFNNFDEAENWLLTNNNEK